MMSSSDKQHSDSLAPYREALAEHGPGFRATLWTSESAQQKRFEVMADMIEFAGAVILDAGCGTGDFACSLLDRGVKFQHFIGIDGLADQVEQARERQLDRSEFHTGDFVHDDHLLSNHGADLICFSGSLNNIDDQTVKTILRRAFNAAARGIVFNFLSNRAHADTLANDTIPARRFDTLDMIDVALTLSHRVRFRQDYLDGHDATIAIEKHRNE